MNRKDRDLTIRDGLGLLGFTSVSSVSLQSVSAQLHPLRLELTDGRLWRLLSRYTRWASILSVNLIVIYSVLIRAVIIWAIFGVATVTLLIAVLTEVYANRYRSALVHKGTRRAMSAMKEHRDQVLHKRFHREDEEIDRERIDRLPYEVCFRLSSGISVDGARFSM